MIDLFIYTLIAILTFGICYTWFRISTDEDTGRDDQVFAISIALALIWPVGLPFAIIAESSDYIVNKVKQKRKEKEKK